MNAREARTKIFRPRPL